MLGVDRVLVTLTVDEYKDKLYAQRLDDQRNRHYDSCLRCFRSVNAHYDFLPPYLRRRDIAQVLLGGTTGHSMHPTY